MKKENMIDALKWRYSTKRFDPKKKLKQEDIEELLEVLRLSPSSFGLQAWKFIVVEDKELREKLKVASFGQSQVTDASHLIVLTAKNEVNNKDIQEYVRFAEIEGELPLGSLKNFEKVILNFRESVDDNFIKEWTKKQTYIALGMLMSAAALKKIDSCPMEGFNNAEVDKILGLDKEGYSVATLCPLGYRASTDNYSKKKKIRYPKQKVISMR
jgi:nitroreductase